MARPTIGFLTYDWSFGLDPIQPNGCAWYRCYLPMQQLKKEKYETGMGIPGFSKEHGFGILIPGQQAIHGWDIVVLKLIMIDRVASEMIEALAKGQKVVVDLDDHMEGLAKSNLAYQMTSPEKNANNNRDHYLRIIENATALITSTPFLKDFYQKKHPEKPVYLVRNGIDLDRWKMRNDHSGYLPTYGWVGATPWRSNDLEILNPFLGEFIKNNHCKFHHSGSIVNSVPVSKLLGVDKSIFTHEPMKPIFTYPELFRKIDVGIVPLNDLEFNHAKSFIKGLEYTAAGIPFIATGLPEYQYLTDSGVGRVANNANEWLQHAEELLNPKTRKEERERNRQIVSEKFSMQARSADWEEVFDKILAL
jgi:glycosyltransferase involved in cell wall biosynthesis